MDSPRQSSPPSAAPPPVKLSSFASFPRTALESTRALVKRRDNIDVAGMQEEGDLNTPLPEQLGGSDLSRKKQKHSRKHKHKHGDKKRRKKDSASSSRHKHGRRGSSDDDSDVSVPDNVTGDMAERDSAIHEEDTSSLFYVDRRGDHENVTVQRTDPARVPKYRRMREDLLVADAHAVAIVGKDVPKSGPARTAVPQTPSADFIAVEDATVATTAFVEDTTSTSTFTHGPLLLRQQQFNAHLTRNPHDIPEWLRFLHFQEELFASQPIHRERAAALREKKLAIVERALAVNAGSMRLWRVYLELFAGGRGVGAEEMNLKWREVLHKADVAESERDTGDTRSTHLALWLEYISFQQRQRPGFRYGRCRDTIAEALRHFCDDGPSALKLLRRLIALDVQCGYRERAWAFLVTMLEIHLFSGGMAFERATACFREHWEGTLPVLGDDGARGWSNYAGTVHAQETTVPTAVDEEESVHHDTTGDTYVDWAASENRADLTTSHPYRATTDPADPERVVLFDDLAPFLVHLSDWSDLAALTRFATEHVFRVTLPWCVDDVVFNSASAKGDDYKDDGGDEDEGPMDAWAWDELAYRQDLSPWFPAPHLLSIIDLFRDPLNDTGDTETFQTPPPSSMLPIARRILDALLDTPLRRHILPYYTYIAEPKTSSRRLKALLRDDTGNVELWLLYAVVVEKLGKVEEARRVCSSVLDMREQLPAAEHSHLAAVCQYLVEMDVRAAALDKALGHLCHFALGTRTMTPTPAQVLRVRKHFADVATSQPELHAWMEYILVATDALPNVTSSADAPLDHALMTLRSLPATLPIAVHTAKMIIYHQRHVAPGAYRPIVLRDHLRACCSVRNASVVFFLRAWLHGEERFRVEGRVTTLMNELCRGDSAPWYMHWFRLHAERHSQHNKDTLSEPLRRRFEDALSGRHAHNATLWTAYLHWEMAARSGSHEHGLARSEHTGHLKSTYFRALQACPWHKRLHLMAFDERNAVLRRAIDGREEREQLLDRMLESELRLRRVPEDEGE